MNSTLSLLFKKNSSHTHFLILVTSLVFLPRGNAHSLTNGALMLLSEAPPEVGNMLLFPTPNEIKTAIKKSRTLSLTRAHKGKKIPIEENQILTKEIENHLKVFEEIIGDNAFFLGGNRDHLPACLIDTLKSRILHG